ncbi:alpha/beta fold hydrolase [Nocardia carnea]|uniref:alpha/beta fold hydrolase n=1 Tax=Nocardia carnea TaxID=37328 RepID=UPI002458D4ED|nr:alpha/beta hydrolase [Nocardia carnea]
MTGMDMVRMEAPERVGSTGLPDGRRLAWAEWGPADGRPVLFCPGAGWGRTLGFGFAALAELDIRLISVERPGSGESTAMPGRTLLDWADDIGRLGVAEPAVVGFSQGAPFALALAARGITAAVAIVSGGDELAHPAMSLPDDVRRLVDLVATDPARAERDFAHFGSAETLWRLSVEGSSEADRAVYLQPDFAVAFGRALDSGFAQGPAGYARDTVLHFARWPFRVEELTARVHLWYGGQDGNSTHSPDHGATLAARIPGATRHYLPDSGAALLWTHGGEILRQLLASAPATPAQSISTAGRPCTDGYHRLP